MNMELKSMPAVFWRYLRRLADIRNEIDTDAAADQIRKGIWFRGANVWILACSILIASVGLNVNSTAVIIGAMLISPLMGPIIGIGLSLGTNDTELLKSAGKNFLVMFFISLLVSTLYFLISPLKLINATELAARTSPTIYDVFIAFFGGLAGILENCRKEKGTVLSGVAIATAIMPPLCTAGYGLAHLNAHYFFGAIYLFLINGVFIILANYLMVKYLRFKGMEGAGEVGTRRRRAMTALFIAFIIPSLWTAVTLVQDNNFERKVEEFVADNRVIGKAYIYDYTIHTGRHRNVEISTAGLLDDASTKALYDSAKKLGINEKQLSVTTHAFGLTASEMQGILDEYSSSVALQIERKDREIFRLQRQIDSLKVWVKELRDTTSVTETAEE